MDETQNILSAFKKAFDGESGKIVINYICEKAHLYSESKYKCGVDKVEDVDFRKGANAIVEKIVLTYFESLEDEIVGELNEKEFDVNKYVHLNIVRFEVEKIYSAKLREYSSTFADSIYATKEKHLLEFKENIIDEAFYEVLSSRHAKKILEYIYGLSKSIGNGNSIFNEGVNYIYKLITKKFIELIVQKDMFGF
jgi:hypothetical protein